jgi:3-hydroxybutyryl-CoA dehydrogenase
MKIEKIIVIGSGTMGQGIAQWFAQQNCQVQLVDQNYEFALKSLEKIKLSFSKLVDNGKFTESQTRVFGQNLSVKKLDDINPLADLVIEAIIENLEVKKELFLTLDKLLSSNTIFASNTSSFSITQLAQAVSEKRKTNFLGLHFFNPATIMKLVEVINGLETNPEVSEKMIEWFNTRKKVACLCSDSPGFIVNRVARNFYGESLRAVETYSPEKFSEVDLVMKEVGGFKMGPFELMDLIGIDINLSVTESVYRSFFEEARFKPHRLQRDLVLAGRLGKKSGKGFYQYETK